jgi:hypothetical protein
MENSLIRRILSKREKSGSKGKKNEEEKER